MADNEEGLSEEVGTCLQANWEYLNSGTSSPVSSEKVANPLKETEVINCYDVIHLPRPKKSE